MVTISAVRQLKNGKDEIFNALEITGDLEMVTSQATGKPYFTVKKMTIPCTFDEALAKTMVGKQLKGEIQRIECDPYDYTNPDTAEVVTLTHTYQYFTNPQNNLAEVIQGSPVLG